MAQTAEAEKQYTCDFSAMIYRGPPGEGFGLMIQEDTEDGGIWAKKVFPTCQVRRAGEGPPKPEGRGVLEARALDQ